MRHTFCYFARLGSVLGAVLGLALGALTPQASWAQSSTSSDSTSAAPRPALSVPDEVHGAADGTTVIEDNSVRVVQTRRRGQVERLRVHSKLGQSHYEIVMRVGRDPSALSLAGKSAWQVLSF
jgi:hypothetical protein